MKFQSERIYLRQVELIDLSILLKWENDPENWKFSDTKQVYSEEEIIDFIVEQSDLRSTDELRLMICLNSDTTPIGAIDLFKIDFESGIASVGILIDEHFRQKGLAFEALQLLQQEVCNYFSFKELNCTIQSDNSKSIQLFTNCSFVKQSVENELESYSFKL